MYRVLMCATLAGVLAVPAKAAELPQEGKADVTSCYTVTMTAADPLMFQQLDHIIALVARRAFPAIYSDRLFVEAGGLMSYGADGFDGWRLAGVYTGRILSGEKPGNLPVQQSTKVELALNLRAPRRSASAFR